MDCLVRGPVPARRARPVGAARDRQPLRLIAPSGGKRLAGFLSTVCARAESNQPDCRSAVGPSRGTTQRSAAGTRLGIEHLAVPIDTAFSRLGRRPRVSSRSLGTAAFDL